MEHRNDRRGLSGGAGPSGGWATRRRMTLAGFGAACLVVGLIAGGAMRRPAPQHGEEPMRLGNFSVSLAVRDLGASRAFYENLGFEACGGDPAQNWLIMKNGYCRIGLFQGMFDKNILTFNPGWDADAQPVDEFDDVREIQRRLRALGVEPVLATDPDATTPAHIVLEDPDGNQVLIDQHVPKAGR